MAFGSLGEIAYDIVAYDKTAAGVASAEAGIGKLLALGVGLAGVGYAIGKVSDQNAQFSRSFEKSMYRMGLDTETTREWVLSLRQADDSISEVTGTLDYFSRVGIKNQQTAEDLYKAYDLLSDAVGEPTDQIAAEVVPVLQAFDISLDQSAEHLNAFAMVMNETTMGDYFTYLVARMAPQLKELNITLEDAAAIFTTLEQHGITGRQAVMAFRNAISDAAAADKEKAKIDKDLTDEQAKLNEETKKGGDITRNYYEDVMFAGRDVGKIRQLTFQYNRDMRTENEKIAAEKVKVADLAKQKAEEKPFDVYASISARTGGRFKEEDAKANLAKIPTYDQKIKDLARIDETHQGAGEVASKNIEVMGIQAGEATKPIEGLASAMMYLGVGITAVTTASALIKVGKFGWGMLGGGGGGTLAGGAGGIAGGLGKAGAGKAATTVGNAGKYTQAEMDYFGYGAGEAASGTNALAILEPLIPGIATMSTAALIASASAGALIGGAAVYGMEKMGWLGLPEWMGGTGHGWVQEQGAAFMNVLSGNADKDLAAQYVAQGLGTDEERKKWANQGFLSLEDKEKYAAQYKPMDLQLKSGTPGTPAGVPVAGQAVAPMVAGNRSVTLNITNLNLSKDYPVTMFMDDVANNINTDATAQGVNMP